MHNDRKKVMVIFNQMITLRATYCPEKTGALLAEMIKRNIVLTNVTFRGLLSALTLSAKENTPENVIRLTKRMSEFGLTPHVYHYGAVIDVFARNGDISSAVKIIKDFPVSRDHQAFDSVLSRCAMIQRSDETEKDVKEKIFGAQDLVDFLDKKNMSCGVLTITYSRLEKLGVKWPE